MAINIYDELLALSGRLKSAEDRLLKLETPAPAPRAGLMVVSYFRKPEMWAATLAAKPVFAMINPGNGPGPTPDALYVQQVPKNRAAGVLTLGYVHSKGSAGYGTRPLAEIKADILNHIAWYGVDGIFIDCTSTLPEHVPYYLDLCNFIQARGLRVCLNPGMRCLEDHARMADWVMCVETFASTFLAAGPRPSWELKVEHRGKLIHCLHSCSAAQMPAVVAKAKREGAGLIYCTDDPYSTDGNPYNSVPSFLSQLLVEIAR